MKKHIAYSGKDNDFRKLLVNILGASGYKTILFEDANALTATVSGNASEFDAVLIDMSVMDSLPMEVSTLTSSVPVIMLCSGPVDLAITKSHNEPFKLGSPLSVPRLLKLLQKLAQQKELTSEKEESGSRIAMVVDDCPSIRLFVREILKSVGYTVTEAENGLEALKILDKSDSPAFTTFIVDLEMPEIDGPHLIRELNQRLDSPQIIITTGTKDIQLLNWARNTGLACGLIEKPFSSKAFIRFLSTHK